MGDEDRHRFQRKVMTSTDDALGKVRHSDTRIDYDALVACARGEDPAVGGEIWGNDPFDQHLYLLNLPF
jgi:cytochrome c peroxidase